ncbi:hypothetical protein BDV96DRAFT_652175 [Lophiotrema nucula]|uniref:Uncharacterized protein n=1 Tax=Lophiotrema nucula TaxID=690887 RepID=A0A6A5YQ13_9PLEO|nr:hypothetical protein BDV96DRAFT_652175 [Lophiotrema nucula]
MQTAEDAKVDSTCEATTLKRSRSPTRRMVHLQIAKEPVVPETATSSADVPQNSEAKRDANSDLDDQIRNATSGCKTKHLHEPIWNELVHSQTLKQPVLDRPGFSYHNITPARIIKELVPGNDENGEIQLSVRALAYFNCLCQLIKDPVARKLPLLLITDARWRLYLSSDLAYEIRLIDAVDIGTAADIIESDRPLRNLGTRYPKQAPTAVTRTEPSMIRVPSML